MNTYKQYHDENNDFYNQMMIYFSQCNTRKEMTFSEILRIASDCAGEDFTLRGMGHKFLTEKGVAFVVSRYSFRIHKAPVDNEIITLHTWEEKNEPLQFIRAFEILNENGEKLVSGMSSWLYIDINARRILPVKKFDELNLRPSVTKQTEHDCLPTGKIPAPESLELLEERKIRASDIDANGHVNNSRYMVFAMDALPEEYRNKNFTDFRINYAKEAVLNEVMQIYANINDAEKKITIIGKVEGNTSFETELYF